jgi:hypothetical protein
MLMKLLMRKRLILMLRLRVGKRLLVPPSLSLDGEGSEVGEVLSRSVTADVEDEEQSVSLEPGAGFSSLLGILQAEEMAGLELGIIQCLASLGLRDSRVEIVLGDCGKLLLRIKDAVAGAKADTDVE